MLSACKTTPPEPIVEVRVVELKPSAGLRIPCAEPMFVQEMLVEDIYTNRDIAKGAFESCSSRMQKIIDWYNTPRSSNP